jgi:RNA polymerase sigma factor (TIGR02999 family)
VEGKLRQLARGYLRRERRDHTLQTGALVNEAYLRLVADGEREEAGAVWQDRAHFYGIAATVMRRILVDHARRRAAAKRGGPRVPLDEARDRADAPGLDFEGILSVHEALERLEELDPRRGRLVELKFFAGLSTEEIAGALGVSTATAKREWRMARAWLRSRIGSEGDDGP